MAKNGKRNGFVRARTGDLLGVSEARYQLRHETRMNLGDLIAVQEGDSLRTR